jgi:tetratricopeptide (TPR) repeat protein
MFQLAIPGPFLTAVLAVATSLLAADGPHPANDPQDLERRLQVLIGQLGSDRYATRERAQADIERIGLLAFDALHAAQDHDDVEIALRARYLLRSLPIAWFRETDHRRVKDVMRGYGDQSEAERASRIEQLGNIDEGKGLIALCRLARFETSHELSKQAALAVLKYRPESEVERNQLVEGVLATIGGSQRPVAEWLRVYALSLQSPGDALPRWREIIAAEQATLAKFPARTTPAIVRSLLFWHADDLLAMGRSDESLAVVDKLIRLELHDEKEVEEMVEWLIDRKFCSFVEPITTRYSAKFDNPPLLLYLLAQAQRELGHRELSEQTSQQAWQRTGEQAESRTPIAERLRDRGLFDWAEREFRQIMTLRDLSNPLNMYARFMLSELLHDIEKHRDAGDVLQPLVEELDRNPMLVDFMQRMFRERDTPGVKSRMHFFYAMDAQARNDRAELLDRLQQAIGIDPSDADVLIAMYRLPTPDDAWRRNTQRMIQEASTEFLKEISRSERGTGRNVDPRDRDEEASILARQCNQFAWLIGNTEGDLELAIRLSHRSLDLRPKASGYYDTLGRCYFAKGDVDTAIKYQLMALKMEPHSGQMRRQLQLFEQARGAARETAGAASDPP